MPNTIEYQYSLYSDQTLSQTAMVWPGERNPRSLLHMQCSRSMHVSTQLFTNTNGLNGKIVRNRRNKWSNCFSTKNHRS